MPWHNKAMKDVAACDKPRGGGKQPLIRGRPNGVTRSDYGQNILYTWCILEGNLVN